MQLVDFTKEMTNENPYAFLIKIHQRIQYELSHVENIFHLKCSRRADEYRIHI